MGGEGCAAHTDDAAFPDDGHQVLGGQGIHFLLGSGLDVGTQFVFVVIFDNHAGHHGAAGVGAGFHSFDGTGNRCVDRDAQTLVVADFLTNGHVVALLDQGCTGCADVLGHGDYQDVRLREAVDLLVLSVVLIFFGMYAAEKRKRH